MGPTLSQSSMVGMLVLIIVIIQPCPKVFGMKSCDNFSLVQLIFVCFALLYTPH